MTTIDRTATVAAIVADHPGCAGVFETHAIDYCCQGDVPLAEVCTGRQLSIESILRELETAVAASAGTVPDRDVRALSVPALIARIVDRHHGYLRTALPFLVQLAGQVARAHGARAPDLVELERVLRELQRIIEPHLEHEERDLFPALLAGKPEAGPWVRAELAAMFDEHQVVGGLLRELRRRADDYRLPAWACNTYALLMNELTTLEGDLFRHVHLENHVLLPRFMA